MSTAPTPASPTETPTIKLPFPLQDNERILALHRRHWWFLVADDGAADAAGPRPAGGYGSLDKIGVRDDLGIFWWIAVLL
jgi:hypothetical protein